MKKQLKIILIAIIGLCFMAGCDSDSKDEGENDKQTQTDEDLGTDDGTSENEDLGTDDETSEDENQYETINLSGEVAGCFKNGEHCSPEDSDCDCSFCPENQINLESAECESEGDYCNYAPACGGHGIDCVESDEGELVWDVRIRPC